MRRVAGGWKPEIDHFQAGPVQPHRASQFGQLALMGAGQTGTDQQPVRLPDPETIEQLRSLGYVK